MEKRMEIEISRMANNGKGVGTAPDGKTVFVPGAVPGDRLLAEVLDQEDWIIEGVYYAWCRQCFADADRIYVLRVPRYRYRYRIIRRFLRRKLGLEQGKKETLRSLRQLLKWADQYQNVNLAEIRELLIPYADKVIR